MKLKITSKKALLLVLSLVMLCSVMCFNAFAADCSHSDLRDNAWETVRETTCVMSGSERQWCFDCKEWVTRDIDIDPDAHVLGRWTVTVPNTCNSEGKEVRYCINCSYVSEPRTIPAHNYQTLYKEDATCMSDGYEFRACTSCFEMITVVIPKNKDAHKLGEWQIGTEATCVKDSGERVRYCLCTDENNTRCEYKQTEKYTDEKNHTEIEWNDDERKAPTCQAPGYKIGICKGCENEVMEELPQHSESKYEVLEESSVPATCSTDGIERRLCACGMEYDVVIPAGEKYPHVYEDDWKITKQPGCEDGERIKRCKYHYSAVISQAIPATGEHNMGDWVETVTPDCSSIGFEERKCADCDYTETRELPTRHDLTIWTYEPKMVCDETQLRDGVKHAKCNNCTYDVYFAVPAEHSYSTWRISKLADCKNITVPGKKERTCSVCGKVEVKEYYAEHDYTPWFTTENPVCIVEDNSGKPGLSTRWCKTCKKYEQKTIPPQHEFVSVEILEYPTCTSEGVDKAVCKYCGIDGTITTPKAEHKSAMGATGCTRDCILCGNSFTKHESIKWLGVSCGEGNGKLAGKCTSCNADIAETTVSLNHPNIKVVTVEPTCTSSGYTKKDCPDCGYSENTIIPATGHKLDANWTTRFAPTCNTPGARYKACADCEYLEFEYMEKSQHILVAIEPEVLPTCTTEGKTSKSFCGSCGAVFESQIIPKLEHQYDEGSEICRVCYAYKDAPKDCTCGCHSTSGIEKILFDLLKKIYSFFGINQECKCGELHYTEFGFFAKLLGKDKPQ